MTQKHPKKLTRIKQIPILMFVVNEDKWYRTSEIAKYMGMSMQEISNLMFRLRSFGYIRIKLKKSFWDNNKRRYIGSKSYFYKLSSKGLRKVFKDMEKYPEGVLDFMEDLAINEALVGDGEDPFKIFSYGYYMHKFTGKDKLSWLRYPPELE